MITHFTEPEEHRAELSAAPKHLSLLCFSDIYFFPPCSSPIEITKTTETSDIQENILLIKKKQEHITLERIQSITS